MTTPFDRRDDPWDLARFVQAQHGVFDVALDELRDGRKRSHWMWFVFPQIAGLGRSPMAIRYAVTNLEEAIASLDHPLLGPRLVEAMSVAAGADAPDVNRLFGSIDAVKLRSSATLFARAAGASGRDPHPFTAVLDRWFAGHEDPATVRLLAG